MKHHSMLLLIGVGAVACGQAGARGGRGEAQAAGQAPAVVVAAASEQADADLAEVDPPSGASASSTSMEAAMAPPTSVTFGVVLITYAGAQGARPGVRSRAEAEALATALVATAKRDFAAAVKRGDQGSTDNAGAMHRGILEPEPETVLFGLDEGEVGGPVDTPRGFWIVKRLD